jgi:hypothetical protein
MSTQAALWAATGGALAAATVAAVAERRRTKRSNLDAVGWIPWQGVQIACFFAALILGVLAVRS